MVITPVNYFWTVISIEICRGVLVSSNKLKKYLEALSSIISKFCVFNSLSRINETNQEFRSASCVLFLCSVFVCYNESLYNHSYKGLSLSSFKHEKKIPEH